MATPPRKGWESGDKHGRNRALWAAKAGKESWGAWVEELEREKGYELCGRGTKQHRPCKRAAGAGTDHGGAGACKKHGGTSRRGREHGQFKTGEHVQGWELLYPEGLAPHVAAARETSEVRRLRELVDMVAGRIALKMEEIQRGENPERPAQFREVLEETLAAVRAGNAEKVTAGLMEMRAMAGHAEDAREQWDEVDRLADKFDRHTRSLWNILKEMRVLVPLDMLQDRMMLMMGEIKRAVEDEVEDEVEQKAVLRRVAHAARTYVEGWEGGLTGERPQLANGDGRRAAGGE